MKKVVKKGMALASAAVMIAGSMPMAEINVFAYESNGNQIAVQAENSVAVQADSLDASGKWGTCDWTLNDGTLIFSGGVGGRERTWSDYKDDIEKIVITGKITFPEGTRLNMFSYMRFLETIEGLDNLDTSNVTDMSDMFYGCTSLETLDISKLDTSNVTDMSSMFDSCKVLKTMDMGNLDTSKVTNMSDMFDGCTSLETLDMGKLNTSNVTNMSSMFYQCKALKMLDISNFDTSKITDMYSMFDGCSSLKKLDVSNFDTSKVTNMGDMFCYCKSLKTLDLSNFDTHRVTSMYGMFASCKSLSVLDLSNFDLSKLPGTKYEKLEMFYDSYIISVKLPDKLGGIEDKFKKGLKSVMPAGKWTDETTGITYNDVESVELLEGHSYKFNPEKMSTRLSGRSSSEGVTLYAKVEGGAPRYTYKYIMHNPKTGKWTLLSDYSTSDNYTFNIAGNGERIIYADVKDALGNVVRASTTITLAGQEQEPLIVEASKNETDKQVTFTANAAGGLSDLSLIHI